MSKLFKKVNNQIIKSEFRREKGGLNEQNKRLWENKLIFGSLLEELNAAILLEKSYGEKDYDSKDLKVFNIRYIDNSNIENNVGIRAPSEADAKVRVMVNYTIPETNILGVSEKLDPVNEQEETPADVAAETANMGAQQAKVVATLQKKLNKETEDIQKINDKAQKEVAKNQQDAEKVKEQIAKVKAMN
jgi:hypothetical protein